LSYLAFIFLPSFLSFFLYSFIWVLYLGSCIWILYLGSCDFLNIHHMPKNYILDEGTAARKLHRMAYEILENNLDEQELILAGIRDSGSVIARNIQQLLQQIGNLKTDIIDISLDKKNPGEITLSKKMDFTNKVIVVIDDVANSGKTMLYAMKPFLAFHPKKIQTLALVERTHKKYPVKTDYVGLSLATTLQEHIYVDVENNTIKGAYMQ
jgi:pyrimidine operon attenuation protein/uracil phosphoribosyltransferase